MESLVQDNPMGDFVDLIHAFWWQSKTPPIPNHHIGKDLSVVKVWMKQGWERDELLGALALYEGSPVTLLVTYKRGNLGLINKLVGRWRSKQKMASGWLGNIIAEMSKPRP